MVNGVLKDLFTKWPSSGGKEWSVVHEYEWDPLFWHDPVCHFGYQHHWGATGSHAHFFFAHTHSSPKTDRLTQIKAHLLKPNLTIFFITFCLAEVIAGIKCISSTEFEDWPGSCIDLTIYNHQLHHAHINKHVLHKNNTRCHMFKFCRHMLHVTFVRWNFSLGRDVPEQNFQ